MNRKSMYAGKKEQPLDVQAAAMFGMSKAQKI